MPPCDILDYWQCSLARFVAHVRLLSQWHQMEVILLQLLFSLTSLKDRGQKTANYSHKFLIFTSVLHEYGNIYTPPPRSRWGGRGAKVIIIITITAFFSKNSWYGCVPLHKTKKSNMHKMDACITYVCQLKVYL